MKARPIAGNPTRPYRPGRDGMTLVELVTSLVIVSAIMIACGSAIVLAVRTLELSTSASQADSPDASVDRILADLQTATTLLERTDTSVAFTVPDRDGDGLPETIRYAWSGTAGDPLTVEYNGASPVDYAENVTEFNLSYLLSTSSQSNQATPQESDEIVLISHRNAPGAGRLVARDVSGKKWAGCYFKPSLPINVLSWKVTKVKIRAKRLLTSIRPKPASPISRYGLRSKTSARKPKTLKRRLVVEIRPADGGRLPSAKVLETRTVPVSSLPRRFSWVKIAFNSLNDLDPSQGLCLVIGQSPRNSQASVKLRYENKLGSDTTTPNTNYIWSNDATQSWKASDPQDSKDLLFYVYGTITTLGEPRWP